METQVIAQVFSAVIFPNEELCMIAQAVAYKAKIMKPMQAV